jgi:hypothetical protein
MHYFYLKSINKPLKILVIFLMLLSASSCEREILQRIKSVYRFDDNTKKVCVVAVWPASSSKSLSQKFSINSIANANKFNESIESYLRKYRAKTITIISYSTLPKPPKQCSGVYQQSSAANYKKCIKAWSSATKRLGSCKGKDTDVLTVGSYFQGNDIFIYVLSAKNTFAPTLKTKQGNNRSASAGKVANRLKSYIKNRK